MDYSECIVTYIDILGFKNLIKTKKPIEIYNILREFHKSIDNKSWYNSLGFNEHAIDEGKLKYFVFSDLMLRARKLDETNILDKEYIISLIIYELLSITQDQYNLITNNNVLVRGTLHIDKLFFEDKNDIVFGPALIEAYQIEEEIALYPRLVISEKCIEFIKSNSFTRNLIRKDFDGIYFADYLYFHSLKVSGDLLESKLLEQRFDKHKNSIIYLNEQNSNEVNINIKRKVQMKIDWLANYHNLTISRLSEISNKSFLNDLKIQNNA